MTKIPINLPIIGEEERLEVLKVLESGILTNKAGKGPMVQEFEQNFSRYIGCKYAVALNSGTSAIHALLLMLDLKSTDEVIVPSFTFVATASVILHTKAKPVFVDVNPTTFTLDPIKLEKVISKNTKAIIPVHLFGHPADMDPINDIAKERDIYVFEDACQAHGAMYKNRMAGNLADAGCFSFYPSKNMTTGEGGMITTNNEEIYEKISLIINHGEKSNYNTVMLGHNFRMPEISAAIGKVQLKKLPEFIKKRTANANFISKNLKDLTWLKIPEVESWAVHCWYMYTLLYNSKNGYSRDEFVEQLDKSGIGAGVYYQQPIHLMPLFKKLEIKHSDLTITEELTKKVLSIPVHPKLSSDDLNYIVETIKSIGLKNNFKK